MRPKVAITPTRILFGNFQFENVFNCSSCQYRLNLDSYHPVAAAATGKFAVLTKAAQCCSNESCAASRLAASSCCSQWPCRATATKLRCFALSCCSQAPVVPPLLLHAGDCLHHRPRSTTATTLEGPCDGGRLRAAAARRWRRRRRTCAEAPVPCPPLPSLSPHPSCTSPVPTPPPIPPAHPSHPSTHPAFPSCPCP